MKGTITEARLSKDPEFVGLYNTAISMGLDQKQSSRLAGALRNSGATINEIRDGNVDYGAFRNIGAKSIHHVINMHKFLNGEEIEPENEYTMKLRYENIQLKVENSSLKKRVSELSTKHVQNVINENERLKAENQLLQEKLANLTLLEEELAAKKRKMNELIRGFQKSCKEVMDE